MSAAVCESRCRVVDAGWRANDNPGRHSFLGRTGRRSKPPPQFGQTFASTVSTQDAQNVHS